MMIHDAISGASGLHRRGAHAVAILHDRPKGLMDKFGPMPGEALVAMRGYGLDDDDIGRYYGVSASSVRRLRRVLKTG